MGPNLLWLCRLLLVLISVGAGTAKLLRPASVALVFGPLQPPEIVMMILGVLQLAAGALLVLDRTARWGASVLLLVAVGGATALFWGAMYGYAAFSLAYVALAATVLTNPCASPTRARRAERPFPAGQVSADATLEITVEKNEERMDVY